MVKKVKQSRYTPWRRLGGEELDGGEWSASRPGRAFTPGERTPGTHCTGDWVGPRAGLDTEDRGKILCPRRGSNPDRPVVQPVVRHYTDWATRLLVTIWSRVICSLFDNAVSVTQPTWRPELKGRGRKREWPTLRQYPGIWLEGLRKTTKISVRTAGLRVETLTHLPNTKQGCQRNKTI
jgi:hypothetical protein